MIDVVAGVIIDREGRVLACQRPPGKHLAGKWEFPGGKVEPGESPGSALIRELQEELGVTVEIGSPLAPVVWDYGSGPLRLLPHRCRITAGIAEPLEHSQLRWLPLNEVWSLDWAAADHPILHELGCH